MDEQPLILKFKIWKSKSEFKQETAIWDRLNTLIGSNLTNIIGLQNNKIHFKAEIIPILNF